MAKSGELTLRQKRAISALLTAPTLGAACEAAGIGRTTLARWLETDAAFVEALNRAQGLAIRQAANLLIAGLAEAVASLWHIAQHGEHEGVRRQACVDLLNMALRFTELSTLEERVKRLEDLLNARFVEEAK